MHFNTTTKHRKEHDLVHDKNAEKSTIWRSKKLSNNAQSVMKERIKIEVFLVQKTVLVRKHDLKHHLEHGAFKRNCNANNPKVLASKHTLKHMRQGVTKAAM